MGKGQLHNRESQREPRGQHFRSRLPQGINKLTLTKAQQKQDRNIINDTQTTDLLAEYMHHLFILNKKYFFKYFIFYEHFCPFESNLIILTSSNIIYFCIF